MQPIERVGAFALLFLVVTVVAVVLWDKSPDDPEPAAQVASRERVPTETRAPAQSALDPKERGRGVGQLGLPVAREKPAAGAPTSPREPLPTASPREELALPAKTRGEASSAERGPTEAPQLEEGSNQLAKRDFGPEPARSTQAPAPITSIVPRAVERSPTTAVHVVKPGETLSDIATARLGQASRWKEIADLNGVDPARLPVGKELRLPAGGVAKGDVPKPSAVAKEAVTSASSYRVASGDSLWRIAERELGDGERWKEIASANPGIDPKRLVAGTTLTLPSGRRSATLSAPVRTASAASKSGTAVASAATAKKKGTVR